MTLSGETYLQFSGIITALFCGFVSGFLFFLKEKRFLHTIWSLFSLVVAFWALFLGLAFWVHSPERVLFFGRLLNYVALFIPVFFFHFSLEFTSNVKAKRTILILSYLLTFFELVFFIVYPSFFIQKTSSSLWFRLYPVAGEFYFVYPLTYLILVTLGIRFLLIHYRKSENSKKNQIIYLLVGLAIGFCGGATTFPLLYGVQLYPFGAWWPAIYMGLIAYAITKHELMDIQLAVTRSMAFLVTLFLFGGGYLGLVTILGDFLGMSESHWIYLTTTVSYVCFVVGLFFLKVQNYLITTAEKKFLSGNYDTTSILQNLSSQLVYVSDRDRVIQIISEEFARSMELKSVYAFIPKNTLFKSIHIEWVNQDVRSKIGESITLAETTLDLLKAFTEPRLWPKLPASIQIDLKKLGVPEGSLVLSMNSLENLEGVLILGPKLTESKYTSSDVAIFSFIANQIIVVFDRITHQEKLRQAYDEVRTLNLELEQKVKEAIALAQQYFHQASLASLVSGIAHEIRNPMTSLLGAVGQVGQAFEGMQKHAETWRKWMRPDELAATELWQFDTRPEDFLLAVGGDLGGARKVFDRLVTVGFLTADGELTEKLDLITQETDWIELGEDLLPYQDLIFRVIKRIGQLGMLAKFLNTLGKEIPRLLAITDNMIKYGVSGGGVNKETFVGIDEFTEHDSEFVFNLLVAHRYLDQKGCVLPAFRGAEVSFYEELKSLLPGKYHPRIETIVSLIAQAPGAVKKPVNIEPIIQSGLSILRGDIIREKIKVVTEFEPNLPMVAGDELRLQQAIFNILFNAKQAMERDEREGISHELSVKVGLKSFKDQYGKPVEGICIAIQDNGPGMSPEVRSKIFNPFFTTKGPTGGKNVGLGLSILQEVILNHSGVVEVISQEGVGTVFNVYLPLYL